MHFFNELKRKINLLFEIEIKSFIMLAVLVVRRNV